MGQTESTEGEGGTPQDISEVEVDATKKRQEYLNRLGFQKDKKLMQPPFHHPPVPPREGMGLKRTNSSPNLTPHLHPDIAIAGPGNPKGASAPAISASTATPSAATSSGATASAKAPSAESASGAAPPDTTTGTVSAPVVASVSTSAAEAIDPTTPARTGIRARTGPPAVMGIDGRRAASAAAGRPVGATESAAALGERPQAWSQDGDGGPGEDKKGVSSHGAGAAVGPRERSYSTECDEDGVALGRRSSGTRGFEMSFADYKSQDDFRMNFLRKLSYEKDQPLAPMIERHLKAMEVGAKKLLELAMRLGTCFIITNAMTGWVEYSAAKWVPDLLPVLQKVRVISARTKYEGQFPGEVSKWKIEAFLEVQRQLDSEIITNLISLGDSNFEMDAVHIMGKEFAQAFIKTIKFRGNPSPEELVKQLELVAQKFEKIVENARNLKIGLERK